MILKEEFERWKAELSYVSDKERWDYIARKISELPNQNGREELESLLTFLTESGMIPPKNKETLVALIHGIRTRAEWHDNLRRKIKTVSSSEVKSIKYGFFDGVSFLIHRYAKKLDHLSEELRLLKRDYPNHELVIVAHSFGTFLTLKFLQKNLDYTVDRILFCGAIICEDYKFFSLANFPKEGSVLNDVGLRDIYPVLAKSFSLGYGASGTFGFNRHQVENRYFDCGHSEFFTDKLFDDYWLPFILRGEIVESESTYRRPVTSYYLNFLALFKGLGLVLVFTILLVVLFLL